MVKRNDGTLSSDDPDLLKSQKWLEKVNRLIEAEEDAGSRLASGEMV